MATVMVGHIEVTPGVCGGKPYITGHRITAQDIVIWHERMGLDPDEIATEYGLELGEVYAALAYYHDHRAETDASIHADEAFITEMRRHTPSRVMEKPRARYIITYRGRSVGLLSPFEDEETNHTACGEPAARDELTRLGKDTGRCAGRANAISERSPSWAW